MSNFIWSRDEYRNFLWWKILWKDRCPFCSENLDYNTLIKEFDFWRIFYNKFSYTGNSMHILLLPKEHKKFFHEINSEEFAELPKIYQFIKNFFWEENYFSFTRETFADWSRSVEHLHMHFLSGVLKWKYIRKMLEKQWFPISQDLNNDN